LKIRLTNNSGLIKEADWGFSWKTLLFGLFVPLVRGDLAWFFIGLFLSICTAGIALLVFPFYYNKIYVKKLLAQGFYPADELSRMTLVNANIIRDQGTPLRVEPEVPKPAAETPAPTETIGDAAVRTVPVAATSVPPVSAPEPNGWKCTSCETENLSEHNFCYSCGHEREKPKPVCPQCGKEHQPGMKFCPFCGTAISSALGSQEVVQTTKESPSPVPNSERAQETKKEGFTAKWAMPLAVLVVILGIGVFSLLWWRSASSDKAQEAYEKALNALVECGRINDESLSIDNYEQEFAKNWQIAKTELKKAADSGMIKNATYEYAQLLRSDTTWGGNYEGELDVKEIIKYLEKSASEGNSTAEYELSGIYEPESERELWYKKALEHNNSYALHDQAELMWKMGKLREALDYFKKAAITAEDEEGSKIMGPINYISGLKGYDYACLCNLEVGYIYEFGIFGQKDLKEALYWYERSMAAGGYTQQYSELIEYYEPGIGYLDSTEEIERLKSIMQ
jgi:TPR repeat protein